ncbi:hypothetical protein F4703DRAFT_1881307 [Phycomyces blakesleeanus]
MLASELPFEILSRISDFLFVNDRLNCVLTCKYWETPFQRSLWKSITVRSLEHVCKIRDAVEYPPNGLAYGSLVQDITFRMRLGLIMVQMNNFFQMFPNLKYLDMGHISFAPLHAVVSKHSDSWKSLVSLTFQYPPSSRKVPVSIFFDILTYFPGLQTIDIFPQHDGTKYFLFNLDNFNTLHKTLPKLKSFKLFLKLADIQEHDIQMILKTKPESSIKTLYLNLGQWEDLWLYYLSYKYPNLRTLGWYVSSGTTSMPIGDYSGREVLVQSSIKCHFPHLETIDFCSSEYTAKWDNIFWDLVFQSNAPIKHLKYKIDHSNFEAIFLETNIRQLLPELSKTLETLVVVGYKTLQTQDIARPEFSHCPHLVEIKIINCKVSIALVNLLDSCIALRRLEFCGGQLCIGSDTDTDTYTDGKPKKHGLRTLDLNDIVADASVFSYISFWCRDLETMELAKARIYGSKSNETMVLNIDMQFTSFKLLRLDHVKYYLSDDLMNKNTTINMVLLSQLSGIKKSKTSQENVNIKSDVDHLAWFHIFSKVNDADNNSADIKQLSEEEAFKITKYYNDIHLKSNNDVQEAKRYIQGQVHKEDWQEDLSRGYVELKCGRIVKYSIPLL